MYQFQTCPRCGEKSYERLKTHCYCVNCNYSPELECDSSDDERPIPAWAEEAVKQMDKEEAATKKSENKKADSKSKKEEVAA